ncbi:MAG: hypothetical protein L0287_23560 [Anaerolineae bacterium]|nr:hypothetical protein [Anaerolineae bacterium]
MENKEKIEIPLTNKEKIEIILKEYDSIRNESLNTITNRFQILSFGLAGLAALAAGILAAVQQAENSTLVLLAFNITIPLISTLILYIWLGEVNRMNRAGGYLVVLEKKINKMAGKRVLGWEKRLRSKETKMTYPYNTVIVLLMSFVFIFPVLGLFASKIDFQQKNWWSIVYIIVLYFVVPYSIGIFILCDVLSRKDHFKSGASFKITEQSLTSLKTEGVPDNVLEKLQGMKNQEVKGEKQFLALLKQTIGDERTVIRFNQSCFTKLARFLRKSRQFCKATLVLVKPNKYKSLIMKIMKHAKSGE